jgi:hypothetical protein
MIVSKQSRLAQRLLFRGANAQISLFMKGGPRRFIVGKRRVVVRDRRAFELRYVER